MLSCEALPEETCPVLDMDEDQFLRQNSPYTTMRYDDLKHLFHSDSEFAPALHIKTRSLQDLFKSRSVEEIEEQHAAISEKCRLPPQVVCGSELNEAPVQYEVKGLLPHELPVIGIYVDKRICPGFRYKVRYNGRDEELFDGEARTLLSVGMGYGKRLTFEGEYKNYNDNYFWSDSDPEGFAFSLDVVSVGDVFVIYSALSEPVGKVTVESIVGHQEETNQETGTGSVSKTVRVMMTCSIDYYQRHQLLDLHSKDLETIEGEVLAVKHKREKKANITCIKNVNFSRLGECTLQVDQ
ncbi:uncharacterized protein [Haliotis cracherodii]|uniref:uncharacterized protein n=1 Tax=Haliotis cracherodii TaxID=6455 RepID=UPI0039E7FF71